MPNGDPTPEQWAAAVLKRLGVRPKPGAIQALTGWTKAEGGHWNNTARYNPLNTTQNMPGSGDTGSQGNISVYRDWDQGIDATVKTLRNGRYGGIIRALKAGDPGRVASAIDASPWGTHGDLVYRTIAGTKAPKNVSAYGPARETPAPEAAPPQQYTTTPAVDNSAMRRQLVGQFLQQGGVRNSNAVLGLAAGYGQAQDVPGTRVPVQAPAGETPASAHQPSSPGVRVSPRAQAGNPVVSRKQSVGGGHDTSGLPGYPAKDYFAPAGTHAVAPVSGKVFKLSGSDPSKGPPNGPGGPLGWSVYIKGTNGKKYFLTHLGSRDVKVGDRVRQGQVIGTVADYASYGRPDHIHQGVSG